MKGTEPHKLGDMDTAKKTKKKHKKKRKKRERNKRRKSESFYKTRRYTNIVKMNDIKRNYVVEP